MEGFKSQKKIACFKEGGQVGYKSRKEHSETKESSADIAQDKKIVKKAIGIHDKQQHEEKTDLSKLKKGGRAKKEVGTVKKYKTGGNVTNVYEAKKSSGDKDNIKKVKEQTPVKLCGGKSVKKMAGGNLTGTLNAAQQAAAAAQQQGAVSDRDRGMVGGLTDLAKRVYNRGKRNLLGTDEQNARAQAEIDAREAAKPAPGPLPAPTPKAPLPVPPAAPAAPAGMPAQKRGGKVKGKK